jgi:hypothetical protein
MGIPSLFALLITQTFEPLNNHIPKPARSMCGKGCGFLSHSEIEMYPVKLGHGAQALRHWVILNSSGLLSSTVFSNRGLVSSCPLEKTSQCTRQEKHKLFFDNYLLGKRI